MNSKNALKATLVLASAAIIVLVVAFFIPDNAGMILAIFMTTVTVLGISIVLYNLLNFRGKTTVETYEIADITENLNSEFVIWTNDCSAVFFNKCLRDLLGIDSVDFDHVDYLKRIFNVDMIDDATILKMINGEMGESKFRDKNGNTVYIIWSTSILKQNKKFSLFLSTGFNITEIKKMQSDVANVNKQMRLSMELSEIGIITSTDGETLHISPELRKMLKIDSNTVTIQDFRALIHPNDRIQFDSCIKKALVAKGRSGEIQNIELRIKAPGGIYRWYSYRFKYIRGEDGKSNMFGGALLDVTEEREKDILIERLAYMDEVTEIANRNKLVTTGQETYECCKLLNYSYWVIVLDIDRFHIVNDTCGYENGNMLLKDFAHMLYKFVGNGGLAARISGDNFALVLRDYGDDELPSRTVASIQDEMTKLSSDEFSSINLTCSAGYSKMPEDGNSFLDVMEHAEFALKSDNSYQGSISAYEPSMHDSIIGNTELEKSLRDAIENNELHLFYQPKIDLSTNKIMGVEALVRWIKPDGTIIKPDSFVPIAEKSHLIGKISEFVLNEACNQGVMWQKMGYPNIIMSINFASTDFYQKDLKDKVFDALVKSGLDAQWLEVELTETLALKDIDYAVSQMNSLRSLGVKLAMDDFGTGYSSLSYLQILPITLLKLDRSFITDIEHDNIAYEIVSAVIRIAKSKKIETIAEGIENERQADILRKAGCDYAQGYLYGKPMPPEGIHKFLELAAADAEK